MLKRNFLCDINSETMQNCYTLAQKGKVYSLRDAQFMRHFTCKHSKTFEYVNNNILLFVAAVFVFPLNCFLRAFKPEEKLLKETI